MKAKSKSALMVNKTGTKANKVSTSRTTQEPGDERNSYLAGLIGSIPDALVSTDLGFNRLEWNAKAERMYGRTAAEVIGQPLSMFIQNENLFGSREITIKTALESGISKGKLTRIRREGTRIPVMASVSPIQDKPGRQIFFIAVNRDITEGKLACEASREEGNQT